MGLYKNLPAGLEVVDIIIAGGGTASCVIASRLADASPELSILVIEGGSNNDSPTIRYPALFLANMAPTSTANTFHQTVKEEQLGGRELIIPTGAVLGGGSSTNFMMYSRAQRSDFDGWNAAGWSANEMLPYLKKLETYHGPGNKAQHGYDGPIQVSGGTYGVLRSQNDFLAAAEKIGLPVVEDAQNLDVIGIQRAMRYISPDGKRQDAATAYLHPRLQDGHHRNLHVLVEHQIVRVLFDGDKRAVGVEFKANPTFQPGDSITRSVKAQKLVIVSCGACGSPAVLERSGVGNPEILKQVGVELVASVPGVGEDFEDHQSVLYPYRSNLNPDETLDAMVTGRADPMELIKNNDKMLGWNCLDVSCKLRPTDAEATALGPKFKEAWENDFKNKPDRPLVLMASANSFPGLPEEGIPPGQYFAISNFSVYPYSRGHIHITGPNLTDPLNFKTGFFSDADGVDIKMLVWAYKKSREIVRRMDLYRGEVPSWHPAFPPLSAAACIDTDGPLANDVQDIQYTADDDQIIEQWLIDKVGTSWHSLGTCKMAPYDKDGVVDTKLSVYGTKGLKVADLSIAPGNVGAHTNNTALAIGEKAADVIIKELGLLKGQKTVNSER